METKKSITRRNKIRAAKGLPLRGRPRVHANNAARQVAYRARLAQKQRELLAELATLRARTEA